MIQPGTIVGSPISKGDTSIKIGTHFDDQGVGGFMVVATLVQRNSLPVDSDTLALNADGISSGQRKIGMRVKVLEDNTEYELVVANFNALPDVASKVNALGNNTNWAVYEAQGGGGNSTISTLYVDSSNTETGDGSPSNPFKLLNDAYEFITTNSLIYGGAVIKIVGTHAVNRDLNLGWNLELSPGATIINTYQGLRDIGNITLSPISNNFPINISGGPGSKIICEGDHCVSIVNNQANPRQGCHVVIEGVSLLGSFLNNSYSAIVIFDADFIPDDANEIPHFTYNGRGHATLSSTYQSVLGEHYVVDDLNSPFTRFYIQDCRVNFPFDPAIEANAPVFRFLKVTQNWHDIVVQNITFEGALKNLFRLDGEASFNVESVENKTMGRFVARNIYVAYNKDYHDHLVSQFSGIEQYRTFHILESTGLTTAQLTDVFTYGWPRAPLFENIMVSASKDPTAQYDVKFLLMMGNSTVAFIGKDIAIPGYFAMITQPAEAELVDRNGFSGDVLNYYPGPGIVQYQI